ncbi:hypothetical protein WDW89_05485 [Deltaproteobacteria bacterium TL4]
MRKPCASTFVQGGYVVLQLFPGYLSGVIVAEAQKLPSLKNWYGAGETVGTIGDKDLNKAGPLTTPTNDPFMVLIRTLVYPNPMYAGHKLCYTLMRYNSNGPVNLAGKTLTATINAFSIKPEESRNYEGIRAATSTVGGYDQDYPILRFEGITGTTPSFWIGETPYYTTGWQTLSVTLRDNFSTGIFICPTFTGGGFLVSSLTADGESLFEVETPKVEFDPDPFYYVQGTENIFTATVEPKSETANFTFEADNTNLMVTILSRDTNTGVIKLKVTDSFDTPPLLDNDFALSTPDPPPITVSISRTQSTSNSSPTRSQSSSTSRSGSSSWVAKIVAKLKGVFVKDIALEPLDCGVGNLKPDDTWTSATIRCESGAITSIIPKAHKDAVNYYFTYYPGNAEILLKCTEAHEQVHVSQCKVRPQEVCKEPKTEGFYVSPIIRGRTAKDVECEAYRKLF